MTPGVHCWAVSIRDEPHGYQSIADDLREQIRAGGHVPGSFLPTERELQTQYGVSRSTIRRALTALAESGWAELKPNRGVAARMGPSLERTNNIAFIDHADSVNQNLFFAISRELQTHSMHLTHIDSRQHGVEGAMEYAADHGFAAGLVWSKEGFPNVERVQAVQKRMPIVAVDHTLLGVSCDAILQDNLGGSEMVVRHLAEQGRRNIAVTGMMDMLSINHDKFSGYLKGLFRAGQQPTPRNFAYCLTSGQDEPDFTALRRRLEDPDRPDAIYVLQDMLVPAVAELVLSLGLRIPEDVALAAYNHELPMQIEEVSLTSVAVNWPAFAQAAVQRVLRRLSHPFEPYAEVVLPVSLIIRGSCGAPRAHWTPEPSYTPDYGVGLKRLRPEFVHIHSVSTTQRKPTIV